MAALLSVWVALGALATTLLLVFTRLGSKGSVLILLPYTLAFSVTLAAAVLWATRKKSPSEPGVSGQRVQARAAIILDAMTFAVLLFWLHGIAKGFAGLAVEGAFLGFVYWLYTRILVPEAKS